MKYLKKCIPASVAGLAAGIVAAAFFGPSAGVTAAADVSRRWMQDE